MHLQCDVSGATPLFTAINNCAFELAYEIVTTCEKLFDESDKAAFTEILLSKGGLTPDEVLSALFWEENCGIQRSQLEFKKKLVVFFIEKSDMAVYSFQKNGGETVLFTLTVNFAKKCEVEKFNLRLCNVRMCMYFVILEFYFSYTIYYSLYYLYYLLFITYEVFIYFFAEFTERNIASISCGLVVRFCDNAKLQSGYLCFCFIMFSIGALHCDNDYFKPHSSGEAWFSGWFHTYM